MITAIAVGSATITATTTDGSNKTDTINITVVVPDADVSIKNFKLNDGTRDYILVPVGDNFIYPYAPRTFALPTTAMLELGSSNATISPDPRTTPLSYASKTQFTITSGDGTTTHTYYVNVGADAYDATTNPYGIYTQDQLSDINNALTASYKLMNNIALTGNWTPIAWATNVNDVNNLYTGSFDGNGKVISNLSISNSDTMSSGLFGYVGTNGNIKNLGVETSTAGISVSTVGAGIITAINYGTISNCYAKGLGLIYSQVAAGAGITLINAGTISNCYAIAECKGSGQNPGVLVGSSAGAVSNCYASGTASGGIFGNGGLLGLNTGTISNSYWDSTVMAIGVGSGSATGATGKTTTDMQSQATVDLLNGTPSSGAWKLNSSGYPKLSWEQ